IQSCQIQMNPRLHTQRCPVRSRAYQTLDHQEDEVFLAEEQPLPTAASPTAQSPDYVLESNPEEDPKEDDDEDPEEDPLDYPADGGHDSDDEDESSKDDEDDDVDIEANDDEEEEEHSAPADSTAVALAAVDQAPSAKETEPFETDESAATPPLHHAYRVTARISIRDKIPISLPPREEISSPPLPVSSPMHVLYPSPPASPIHPLGYLAVMIRLRAEVASTSHLLPLPPPIILSHTRPDAPSSGTPPMHLLSIDRRADRPKVTLPPWKRLGIALGPKYEVRKSSSAAASRLARGLRADYGFVATIDREIRHDLERDVGYGIIDSWDEIVEAMHGTLVLTDVAEFSQRMTEFETRGRSMDASDLARAEVMSLHTTVLAQHSVITELQAVDRRRQAAIIEMLAANHRRQKQFIEALKLMKRLQT
ncbi:hypothetical protein Tco_0540535, partial [Tanacetum coccineum]